MFSMHLSRAAFRFSYFCVAEINGLKDFLTSIISGRGNWVNWKIISYRAREGPFDRGVYRKIINIVRRLF